MSISTRFFVGLEDEQEVSIYPQFLSVGRKGLLFYIAVAPVFEIFCIIFIVTGYNTSATVWVSFILLGVGLFLGILQLIWGSIFTINEQMFSLRPNPFLQRIDIRWEEITSIRVSGKPFHLSLDIILSAAHVETFLLGQSSIMRKSLARRLERTERIACFPRWLSIYYQPLPISLFYLVQERYHQQVQQYHIMLRDERG